jgi:hypothetical protein
MLFFLRESHNRPRSLRCDFAVPFRFAFSNFFVRVIRLIILAAQLTLFYILDRGLLPTLPLTSVYVSAGALDQVDHCIGPRV